MPPDDWQPELPPGRLLQLPGRGSVFVRDIAGPPGAPVLVLLHGWTATSDLNWFAVLAELGQEFRVVAFDHRGHGRGIRSWHRFRMADCADDVVAVADALGIDRFVPVGYSMGGPIGMLVWRRHRDRVLGLVLCATATNFNGEWPQRFQFALFGPASIAARLPERWCRPLFDRVIWSRTRDQHLHPWIIDQIRSGDPRLVVEAGFELGRFDNRSWVGDIDVPTALLVTSHDSVVPTARQEQLAAALADVVVIPVQGDHDVCVRHPRRFRAALFDACRRVCDRAGVPAGADT